jgi:hypothetical protein
MMIGAVVYRFDGVFQYAVSGGLSSATTRLIVAKSGEQRVLIDLRAVIANTHAQGARFSARAPCLCNFPRHNKT